MVIGDQRVVRWRIVGEYEKGSVVVGAKSEESMDEVNGSDRRSAGVVAVAITGESCEHIGHVVSAIVAARESLEDTKNISVEVEQ